MSKYQLVKKAIDKLDVYGLLEGGAPDDEFDSESKEIADEEIRHLLTGES